MAFDEEKGGKGGGGDLFPFPQKRKKKENVLGKSDGGETRFLKERKQERRVDTPNGEGGRPIL